jgi:hypothetical protein
MKGLAQHGGGVTTLLGAAVVVVFALLSGCGGHGEPRRPAHFYSFEAGLEGWLPRGLDLDLADGEILWSIEPSTDRATDGGWSLRLFLGNDNDAGKIFIERVFELAPHRSYVVTIDFALGTADWGEGNLFTVIAGALATVPQSPADLTTAFQDSTGNGHSGPGYVWVPKRYTIPIQTDATGRAVIVVGIWGTWETARTYFLDALGIDFRDAT